MLFFVKVRIDMDRFEELRRRLVDGTLDRSALLATHCHRYDPEVGLSIWQAEDLADFRRRFAPWRAFYRDVVEVTPVVTSAEAMGMLTVPVDPARG